MRVIKRLLALGLVLTLVACSSGHNGASSPPKEMPKECTAFVAKYRSCVASNVPTHPELAQQRADQTRNALDQELRSSTDVAAMTKKCSDNLRRLTNCN